MKIFLDFFFFPKIAEQKEVKLGRKMRVSPDLEYYLRMSVFFFFSNH